MSCDSAWPRECFWLRKWTASSQKNTTMTRVHVCVCVCVCVCVFVRIVQLLWMMFFYLLGKAPPPLVKEQLSRGGGKIIEMGSFFERYILTAPASFLPQWFGSCCEKGAVFLLFGGRGGVLKTRGFARGCSRSTVLSSRPAHTCGALSAPWVGIGWCKCKSCKGLKGQGRIPGLTQGCPKTYWK